MKVSEKIFVGKKRSGAMEAGKLFEHDGKQYNCHTEGLLDEISMCLQSIKNYGRQVDIFSRDGGNCDDVGDVICALTDAAMAKLKEINNDFEKHIGSPGVIRTTYGNGGRLPGNTVVGVSFMSWGGE